MLPVATTLKIKHDSRSEVHGTQGENFYCSVVMTPLVELSPASKPVALGHSLVYRGEGWVSNQAGEPMKRSDEFFLIASLFALLPKMVT